jgi:hypothetical protein
VLQSEPALGNRALLWCAAVPGSPRGRWQRFLRRGGGVILGGMNLGGGVNMGREPPGVDHPVSLAGVPACVDRFRGLQHAPRLPREELGTAGGGSRAPRGPLVDPAEALPPPHVAELDAVRQGVLREADGAAHAVDLEWALPPLVLEVVLERALHAQQVAEVAAAGGEERLHAAHGLDADGARVGGGRRGLAEGLQGGWRKGG